MSTPERLVVVGAGPSGIAAAGELRAQGYGGQLVVIDPAEFPYDRPPLSKSYLLGQVDAGGIALVPKGWFEDHRIEYRAGRRATRIVPSSGIVELDDDTVIRADAVLLTTGGSARQLPFLEARHSRVTGLRTLADADLLRDSLERGVRLAVIGAGLIGAEVASAAAIRSCSVTLIDPIQLPLENVVGPELAAVLHEQHRAAGIDIVADSVDRIVHRSGGSVVQTGRGLEVPCDLIVAGIGMVAACELAVGAGLSVDNGILINSSYQSSNPSVYAAGDVARMARTDGFLVRSEHWRAANRTGRAAAAAILGRSLPDPGPESFWSDRHGVRLEVVGTMAGTRRVLRRDSSDGSLVVFGLDGQGRLRAAAAIDAPRTVAVAERLIHRRAVVEPVQLADPAFNLRELLRSRRD